MTPATPVRTAEARWFLPGPLPGAVEAWFAGLGPSVAPETRTDRYLAPTDDALGVKLREGRVEAKRRDAALGPLAVGRAEGAVEAWTKWAFRLADTDLPTGADWIAVAKTRRQQEMRLDAGRCRLDLSEVMVDGSPWWSVCLEAEGPSVEARRTTLAAGAARWLSLGDAPALPAEAALGYPAWLRRLRPLVG